MAKINYAKVKERDHVDRKFRDFWRFIDIKSKMSLMEV